MTACSSGTVIVNSITTFLPSAMASSWTAPAGPTALRAMKDMATNANTDVCFIQRSFLVSHAQISAALSTPLRRAVEAFLIGGVNAQSRRIGVGRLLLHESRRQAGFRLPRVI